MSPNWIYVFEDTGSFIHELADDPGWNIALQAIIMRLYDLAFDSRTDKLSDAVTEAVREDLICVIREVMCGRRYTSSVTTDICNSVISALVVIMDEDNLPFDQKWFMRFGEHSKLLSVMFINQSIYLEIEA